LAKWSRNKFNVAPVNRRTYKGRTYDSRAEMLYAQHLDLLVRSGDVVDYCDQPKVHISGDLWYRPDYLVLEPDDAYYVDVKGVMTDGFRKVMAAWPARTGLPLRVIKHQRGKFITTEVVGSHHAQQVPPERT